MAPFSRTHSNRALFSPSQIFYLTTHFVIGETDTQTHDFKEKYFTLINISGNMGFVAVKHEKTFSLLRMSF